MRRMQEKSGRHSVAILSTRERGRDIVLKGLLLLLLLSLMVPTVMTPRAEAAVPKLDNIRVGMFFYLPGKYTETTAKATLSSDKGLIIGDGAGATTQGFAAGSEIVTSLDQFRVKVFEGKSFSQALAAYDRVAAASGKPTILSVYKDGVDVYQVVEGNYSTLNDATTAANRWKADQQLSKLPGVSAPQVRGTFHLEASGFASKEEALQAVRGFGAAGVDAYLAVRFAGDGSPQYSAMAGAEATKAELQLVAAALADSEHSNLLGRVEATGSYVLVNRDHSLSKKAGSSVDHYMLPVGQGAIRVYSQAETPIKFTERSERVYRGSFELASFNDRLSVVNELPFEQYLYSVVGREMSPSWPIEALKAQAVAARTYALSKGMSFQIAHVVDTTLSQAYQGISGESSSVIEAVNATAGEAAMYNGKLIEMVYSSNSGGLTAGSEEVWGGGFPYLKPVPSPDEIAQEGLPFWYEVITANGKLGYIREDLLTDSGEKTALGLAVMSVNTEATRVRKSPLAQTSVGIVAELNKGSKVTVLDRVVQSNPYAWVRGPFTSAEMQSALSRTLPSLSGTIRSLEVVRKGASGRAMEVQVNGQKVPVSSPDGLRSALGAEGSLPSTLFEIEALAQMDIVAANGAKRTRTDNSDPLHVIGADGKVTQANSEYLFVLDGEKSLSVAALQPAYRFVGTGYGHGVGMSQYGALALARQGFDYKYILSYYYKDITITKD